MESPTARWWEHVQSDLARPERPVERDLFLAAGTLAIVAVAQMTKPGTVPQLLGLAPPTAALTLRGLGVQVRSLLLTLLVVPPVTLVVMSGGQLEIALFLPVLVVLYSAWHLGSTIRAVGVLVVCAAAPLLVALRHPAADIEWMAWTAAAAFMFVLGRTLREHRALIDELRDAREELARRAVGEERRRIARDLHDLAGHTLAAVMLHVTGARHVLDRDPAEARRALEDAETVGRASLDQIRSAVANLRADERGIDPPLAGTGELADLVATYTRAGLRIDADIAPSASALDGPVGNALHRIAQEALTNVARHAPHNMVSLRLTVESADDRGTSMVVLTVTDAGHRPTQRPGEREVARFGLVGMLERARALGGDLVAGPFEAGWRVRATIPLGTPHPARDDRAGRLVP